MPEDFLKTQMTKEINRVVTMQPSGNVDTNFFQVFLYFGWNLVHFIAHTIFSCNEGFSRC